MARDELEHPAIRVAKPNADDIAQLVLSPKFASDGSRAGYSWTAKIWVRNADGDTAKIVGGGDQFVVGGECANYPIPADDIVAAAEAYYANNEFVAV